MGKKRRPRRRKSSNAAAFWIIGSLFFICVTGAVTWLVLRKTTNATGDDNVQASPDLKKVRDELDRSDPGWRLRDLSANQRKLSDAKNGGKIVLDVYSRVPKDATNALAESISRLQPFPQPIPEQELGQLRANLQRCGQQVAEMRKLHSLPDGAYSIDWNFKRPIDTKLPHDTAATKVCPVLVADSYVRACDKDGQGAAESANGLINMGHYHRDVPILIDQLVGIAIRQFGVMAIERALTCANVPDNLLLLIQQNLEAETKTSGLRVALRGERAMTDQWAISATKGESDWGKLKVSDDDVAWCLQEYNAMIALADKPVLKHAADWEAIQNKIIGANNQIKNIVPAVTKVNVRFGKCDAYLQTAAIGIAAERYRRAKGKWPTELNQLAPTYMKSVPLDKYTGEPFRMARVDGGFTVYSLPKGVPDFQGAFSSIGIAHDGIGFRLIDANLRR